MGGPQQLEGSTGIGPRRRALVQSNVPAAEEELRSLHGDVDSSERWLWVHISGEFGGDCISRGQDSVTDPLLPMQTEGLGLASECPCSWEGAEAALAPVNLWHMSRRRSTFSNLGSVAVGCLGIRLVSGVVLCSSVSRVKERVGL